MDELTPLAREIISLLVFEEEYNKIIAETTEVNKYAVKDELKGLIVKDFVKPATEIETGIRKGFIYDSDSMHEFSYCLTAKGYRYLEKILKH